RVKRLEKKKRSGTHKLKRLYKVGLYARVVSSDDEGSWEVDDEMFDADKDLQGKEVVVAEEVKEVVADKETINEITLAKAFEALKTAKPKIRGIAIREHEELSESPTTTTHPISSKSQDKGKEKMVEEPVKPKKKAQILLDEETARKLQAKIMRKKDLQERELDLKEKELNKNWKLTLLSKKAKAKTAQERSLKRAGTKLEQESSKRHKLEDEKETTELKQLVNILPEEEGVAIDAIPLATKPLSIIDWKVLKEGKKSYYQIIRADGSTKKYLIISHMLKEINKEDAKTGKSQAWVNKAR
nr:hypothetical protein [Tanacetum cinerariifolium]